MLLFAGKRLREPLPGWIATVLVAAAFGVAVVELIAFTGGAGDRLPLINRLYEWIVAGPFRVEVAFRVDQLSLVMALTVTGVGSLIHLYAIQYLHGDPRYTRFFAYFNLFVFFMLVLVLANNFLVMFVGWEGVGLCSYLLIGFWYERKSAADAAKKAFIVTRIGDAAFLLGIAYVWLQFRTLDFEVVFARAPELATGVATIMALLLFAGAVGKSAQLPLHVWLPDAMEGPTPVSALIHAATMVTAGVYLVVRANSIFLASGVALDVVAWVGIVTAVYAGLCAIGQDDIKRMLAYSTISQLGFMFFGAGVGAFGAAIFLLVAHAFFKAMLFLDAGNVMHGLHEETDLMRMGALRRAMPVTAITWLIGWLAMSGIPPFSGFFAKDQVIAAASEHGHVALWVVALIGAFLTAVYMTRGTLLAFFGRPRTEVEPHEAPSLMRLAVIVLASPGRRGRPARPHRRRSARAVPGAGDGADPRDPRRPDRAGPDRDLGGRRGARHPDRVPRLGLRADRLARAPGPLPEPATGAAARAVRGRPLRRGAGRSREGRLRPSWPTWSTAA